MQAKLVADNKGTLLGDRIAFHPTAENPDDLGQVLRTASSFEALLFDAASHPIALSSVDLDLRKLLRLQIGSAQIDLQLPTRIIQCVDIDTT